MYPLFSCNISPLVYLLPITIETISLHITCTFTLSQDLSQAVRRDMASHGRATVAAAAAAAVAHGTGIATA